MGSPQTQRSDSRLKTHSDKDGHLTTRATASNDFSVGGSTEVEVPKNTKAADKEGPANVSHVAGTCLGEKKPEVVSSSTGSESGRNFEPAGDGRPFGVAYL